MIGIVYWSCSDKKMFSVSLQKVLYRYICNDTLLYTKVFLIIIFHWFQTTLTLMLACCCRQKVLFSSTGCRPASLCHGPLSVVRPSVCALTFSLNIFFAETTYRILMKFHRNVPTMVLFRIS